MPTPATARARLSTWAAHIPSVLLGCVCLGIAYRTYLLLDLPIYSDEAQWKMLGSRLFLDDFRMQYLFPGCPAGFLQSPPLSWLPSRYLDAALYADLSDPMWLRYSGVLTYVVVFAAMGWLLRHLVSGPGSLVFCVGLAFAATSFGVVPALLVMNRPEQAILVPFLLVVCICVWLWDKPPVRPLLSWLLAAVFALCACLMLGGHIKSFVLAPAVLLAGWMSIRRPLPFAAFALTYAYAFYETYILWEARTHCPEVPFLQTAFSNLSLSPRLLTTDAPLFFQQLLGNLGSIPFYVQHMSLRAQYQSDWMPPAPTSTLDDLANGVLVLTLALMLSVAVAGAVLGTWTAIRRESLVHLRVPSFTALLLGAVGALGTYQITKNFYEVALIWPLLMLAAVLGGSVLVKHQLPRRLIKLSVPVMLTAVLVSQTALIVHLQGYQPAWRQQQIAALTGRAELAQLATTCGVRTDAQEAGLVVSDFAYPVFRHTFRPVLLPFLSGWWATGLDQRSVIARLGLRHYIGECLLLPAETSQSTIRSASGNFCCSTFGL